MKNKEVSKFLKEIALLLELKGENPFRIKSYEKAAMIIESIPEPVEKLSEENKLHEIKGIGKSIEEKVREYINTNKISLLIELKKEIPEGLIQMCNIPGFGPKRAKIVFDKLKIKTVEELKKAAEKGLLNKLDGFGEKITKNILRGIKMLNEEGKRILLYTARMVAEPIVDYLRKNRLVKDVSVAGSLRRGKETIGDIDILCTSEVPENTIKKFTKIWGKEILASGKTKASIITDENIQVDLRVVGKDEFGSALQYFTGSKNHNIELRELALKKNFTINEYGLFKVGEKNKKLAGKDEKEIYEFLGLQFIPPELREARGEIEAAIKHRIPKLIELRDIKGDIHIHSNYSDGANTITEIVKEAEKYKYEWIIITDHSMSLKVANGVSIEDLKKKKKEIEEVNKKTKLRVIFGTEIDILDDGSIDYPLNILKEFEFVIASIHTGFKQTADKITRRIKKALSNPYVDILGHPTGRLLGKREPYEIDLEEVLNTAKKYNKMIEINAHPERQDLYDIYCKKAKEMGIMLGIGTDSHSVSQLKYMSIGITVARRGWLEKSNVINTFSKSKIEKYIKERKKRL